MHLRTLTLRGFKSFARSTTMRFESGINCVVGPNGSGKSNVVDALAWVMGEQGAKNLRGGSMADVIFAGTAQRPALGRAEVSLTIDNTDGALPIDYSEVTISRTLFRSGGSEYAINGTACRLLDIQELLSDTGMGREMHVIIGQGKLDEVLTASPEERRGFVEEAAGVLKHRRRKERALRKIDAMAASFTRVEDLSAELRRQLGPLAKQAEAARRAQVIQAEVRDARARILADDVAQLEAQIAAGTEGTEHVEVERAANREAQAQLRAQIAALETRAGAADPERAKLTERWERISSLEERFRSLEQLAAERHRSLAGAATPRFHGELPEDIKKRAERARTEEETLRAEVEQAGTALNKAIEERTAAESAERAVEAELAELTRVVADRREEAARTSGKIHAVEQRLDTIAAELDRLARAIASAQQRADTTAQQCRELEEEVVAGSEGNDPLAADHEEASRAFKEAQTQFAAARDREQALREEFARWKATREALEGALAPEDATAWVKENFAAVCLAKDRITVEPGWENAAEAVLAGIVEGVVVPDSDTAISVLRAVRDSNAGHVDIAIDTGEAHATTVPAPGGGAVVATDVVSGAGVTGLLDGVYFAADLAEARRLISAGARCVATAAGDVMTQYSAQGGEVRKNGLLERQRAHDEAREHESATAEQLEQAREAVRNSQERLRAARERYEQSSTELNAQDSRLAAAAAQLGILRQNLTAALQEAERGNKRIAELTQERASYRSQLEALRTRFEAVGQEPEELAQRVAQVSQAKEEAHVRTRDARASETEARLRLRTREERLRAVMGRADALMRDAEALAEKIAREERAAARKAAAARVAKNVGENAARAVQITRSLRLSVGEARTKAEQSRSALDRELSAARHSLDELISALRVLDDTSHQRELVAAQLQLRHDQLAAAARETLGMETDVLVAEYGPLAAVPTADGAVPYVREEQEKRLAKAERSLTRLGRINPLALEEHAALEERQKYLANQLADLKKSRADLLQLVHDLDSRLDEALRSAFSDVSEKFEQVFARLFPGGEGHLILTEPDSPLTTGIEIEARPPGKRVKRLSLLSGGERSLTAIAFLVAIFMARPSPFYVMDEVEAALDDTNLSRLLDIFRDLKTHSQLLIVTHQKRTMEIADTIYGVTMKDDGVTHVVSQRMADIAPH
ncbi:MAG: chromosome segregation protein SMC [Ancrocorticia sp.]|nr:chromosome segregation protein SMC [Ancrocorticia sp.]MCI1932985.1 chromosome segregation protein SMC [Ancrocorticia sp.]